MDTETFALIFFVDILARFMTQSGDSHYDDPFLSFFSPFLSGCQRTLRLVFLQLGAGLSTCNVRDFICLYAEVMTFAQTAFAILNSYVFLGKYRVAVSKHLLFRTTI